MVKKSYLIIGMSRFGLAVVKTLVHTDIEVMVIDKDSEKLEDIAPFVTDAICADPTDPDVLESLGIKNFDGVLITGDLNLEGRVLITMLVKELGAPFVMCVSSSDLEGRALKKIGADKLIYPERDMGIHIGNEIAKGNLFDSIELNESHSIMDLEPPKDWIGKSIKDLNIRNKYGVSVIGIRTKDSLEVNPKPDYKIMERDVLVVLGENRRLAGLVDYEKKNSQGK